MKTTIAFTILASTLLLLVACGTTNKIEALKPDPSNNAPVVFKNKISFVAMPVEISLKEIESQLNKNLNKKDALRLEILLEKYCSVIGLPTYQDVLRTKNLIGVPIKSDDTEIIPQRFLYPLTESSSNSNFPTYFKD